MVDCEQQIEVKQIKTKFKVLKAYNGDCILIKSFDKCGNEVVILIDGGTSSTFDYSLKKEIQELKCIDLIILTHIDSDHIGGLIRFFKNTLINKIEIKNIWVNFPEIIEIASGEKISFGQAKTLERLISENIPEAIVKNFIHSENDKVNFNGVEITIISPTKEILNDLYENWPKDNKFKTSNEIKANISKDTELVMNVSLSELNKLAFIPDKTIKYDLINASSISIILECLDLKLLLLADSRPEIIEQYLTKNYSIDNKIKVDYVKISHHGSKNNTSQRMLNYIDCDKYIISTNGGTSIHKHPSRETIARIIYNEMRDFKIQRFIYFNYPLVDIKKRIGNFITDSDINEGNWKVDNINEF